MATLLATLLGGLSCVNDLGPRSRGEPVDLALNAVVTGLTSTVAYDVSVQVSYLVTGGSSRPLRDPFTFQVNSGDPPARRVISIPLTTCLEDSERIESEPGHCRLSVTITLREGGVELAQTTQDLGLVEEGDNVEPPAISMTPSYALVINGGGTGTGSGIVTVAEAGGQPALSCQITDGQATSAGCTARYPVHTLLALTASGGTLEAWSDVCSAPEPATPCALTMDGHRTVTATFRALATTGELEVQIAGLPAGILGQVNVAGPGGFSRLITETTLLTALLPGAYTVTATAVDVPAEVRTYTPTPEQQSVTVMIGERATVQVGYNPPETGSLAVAITGLPAGTAANVAITGPNGFAQALTASQTLSGLEPGAYTITGQTVETSDQIYAPVPTTQSQRVEANQTTQAAVAYSATRASLTVTISGLPQGTDARVRVVGPGRYLQDLTQTTAPPLTKLAPGSYAVSASPVMSATEEVFDPVVTPRQPILIRAGSNATVAVAYGPPAAAKLVFTQQPTTTLIDSVIKPPVVVEVRDRLDRVLPGYTTPVLIELQDSRGASLGGTTTIIPQNGVATFSDLTVDRVNSGYTLVASSGTLPAATSDAFAVTGGIPTIVSIDFPKSVSNGPGTAVEAAIGFADPARDITNLLVTETFDPNNVYTPRNFSVQVPDPGTDVVRVNLWTCSASQGCPTGPVTLQLRLQDAEDNISAPITISFNVAGSAPTITDITFPDEIPGGPGDFTRGRIDFTDPDGDIVLVDEEVVRCVSLRCVPEDFDPRVSGRTEGSLSFSWGCFGPGSCAGAEVTVRFTLVDVAGNRSNAVDVSFEFVSGTVDVRVLGPVPIAGSRRE